ncbi:MAG: hypothetical protein H7Z39_02550 [Burkholderiaceae bacterium]|nr:hypothetical protein [Burkholderiaceae bacterium]
MNETEKSSFNGGSGIQAARDVRADLHRAIDTAAEKAQPMAERLASGAHAGVDRVGDTVNQVSGTLSERGKQVSGTLSERGKQVGASYKKLAETGRGYVVTSPVVSLLVAVAAGFGLSKLLSQRK